MMTSKPERDDPFWVVARRNWYAVAFVAIGFGALLVATNSALPFDERTYLTVLAFGEIFAAMKVIDYHEAAITRRKAREQADGSVR